MRPKLSDYANTSPPAAEFSLEERLSFACMLVKSVRELYGHSGATERAVERIKMNHAREALAERLQHPLSENEHILLHSLLHA